MSEETTNQGYIDAKAYAEDPSNVSTPDRDHQEYGRGIDSFALATEGGAAALNSIITPDTINDRIGIGATTPLGKLHVQTASSGAGSVNANADELIVEGSGNVGLTILAGASLNSGIYFGDGGFSSNGQINYDNGNEEMEFGTDDTIRLKITATGELAPNLDNAQTVGTASRRWSEIFAANATINTSDEREKTIVDDNEKVLDAIDSISVKAFKWNDAIAAKGESDARIHYGVIAQEVKSAFEAQGLVAEDYGVLCYNEWEAKTEVVRDENGEAVLDANGHETVVEVLAAGNRYGVRYSELYALKIAALERKIAAL